MFDLEKKINTWLKSFRKHRAYNEASFQEMEMHLRDHIEDLVSEGIEEKVAFERAVAEFGDIPKVAKEEFSNQRRKRTLGRVLYATLFKNYYKTSLRGMMRNPLSSFINIVGLAAAIGVCVFTYSFAQWTIRTDQFHENKHEVFLATFFANRDDRLQQNGRSPRPLADALRQDFPHIDDICRVEVTSAVVKRGENVFHERLTLADPSYLSMFTFPLKLGDKNTLSDVNSVIIRESIAEKYFGEEDPLGKEIFIKYGDAEGKTFVVTGVAEEFPASISFNFNFLIHYDNIELLSNYNKNDWSEFVDATFIHLKDTTQLSQITQQMDQYRLLQNESKEDWQIASFAFEPLATLHKRSANIRNVMTQSSAEGYAAIMFLVFVGVFMLVLACFNYINIAIVTASKRLKEIGIRKTIGANKRLLIIQFLSENLIATTFALILGVLLGAYVFIPWFESLFFFDMGFRWSDLAMWIYLPIILVVTALASGLYPAFYISKFLVTGILKGTIKFGKKNSLTKVILGFQLVLSCMFITCAIMFTRNAEYLANRSWGYDENSALYTQVPDEVGFNRLQSLMAQEPDVLSIAASQHHLGEISTSTIVELPSQNVEVEELAVDANYFNTLGVELVEGRGFIQHTEGDRHSIVVNQQFAKEVIPENTIGATLKIKGDRFTIVGIVKDFHSYDFESKVEPTFFRIADPSNYQFLSVKVSDGKQDKVHRTLQRHWAELYPETPFTGVYQEDVWGMYFVEIDIHGKVWRGIASIAILLAGLGLYGLVTINVTGRIREFSIRKILGADVRSLAKNISKQYVLLYSISLSLGACASYFLISVMFDFAYVYHIPVGIDGALLAVFILIAVLLFVIATQLSRVSKSNPVEGLQVE